MTCTASGPSAVRLSYGCRKGIKFAGFHKDEVNVSICPKNNNLKPEPMNTPVHSKWRKPLGLRCDCPSGDTESDGAAQFRTWNWHEKGWQKGRELQGSGV